MEQQHAIGKLSLEVQLPSRQDAFSLQSRLSSRCTTELAPLLAELLDSWTAPGELLQIDKLEIDLGSCSLETLERELPQLIIAFLRKRFPAMREQTYLEEGMSRITLGQGYFTSWLYFLEYGILPHNAVRWTRQEWEAGVLETLSTESNAYQQCFELLVKTRAPLERLVLQFSAEFVKNWLLAYSGSTYQPLLQLVMEWETFCYHPQLSSENKLAALIPVLLARADFHLLVIHWLIKEVVLPARKIESSVLLKELMELQVLPVKYWLYILQQLPVEVKSTLPLLQTAALKLSEPYAGELALIDEELAVKAAQIAINIAKAAASASDVIQNSEASEVADSVAPPFQISDLALAKSEIWKAATNTNTNTTAQEAATKTNTQQTEINNIPEGTTLYINNAGLILLHPYLGILFDALHLKDEEGFKDLHKAIQLLGYLASGEDDIPEYDLVLPKLFCGILPSQPVKRFVSLTDTEKKEADELLLSVIEHWNALGSTTPDGLRGNFLMREGKLEWKEEEWQLYVTQQPYDMLLNRLPWGFSVVGFSWMPWLIKTVWT
jgi:hypothetical protein